LGYLAICQAMSVPPIQIPAGLAAAYGVSQNDLRFITQVQNYIFAYEINGEEYILRLTPRWYRPWTDRYVKRLNWLENILRP
jgi:hypothetical protein